VRASTLDRMLGPSFYRAAFAAFDYYCQKYIHRHAHHTQIGTLTPGRTHVHLSHAVIGKHHSLLLVAPDLFASLSEYRTSLLCFYQMYRVAKGDPHDIVGGKKEQRKKPPTYPIMAASIETSFIKTVCTGHSIQLFHSSPNEHTISLNTLLPQPLIHHLEPSRSSRTV
jgi:hypothetical protein